MNALKSIRSKLNATTTLGILAVTFALVGTAASLQDAAAPLGGDCLSMRAAGVESGNGVLDKQDNSTMDKKDELDKKNALPKMDALSKDDEYPKEGCLEKNQDGRLLKGDEDRLDKDHRLDKDYKLGVDRL